MKTPKITKNPVNTEKYFENLINEFIHATSRNRSSRITLAASRKLYTPLFVTSLPVEGYTTIVQRTRFIPSLKATRWYPTGILHGEFSRELIRTHVRKSAGTPRVVQEI